MYYPNNILKEIDTNLNEQGLPVLQVLLDQTKNTIIKVLSSQKITTIDDYYIVKEILNDTTSKISNQDRTNLSNYMVDFEKQNKKH